MSHTVHNDAVELTIVQAEDRLDTGSPAVISYVESILAMGLDESLKLSAKPVSETTSFPKSDRSRAAPDYTEAGSAKKTSINTGDQMRTLHGAAADNHLASASPTELHHRIVDTVEAIMERRNARERKALEQAKAKTGAARIAYNRSTGGAVPVFGVNPERLPRHRVVPIVNIETKNIKSIKRKKVVTSQ
eukprot:m.384286 g.384286  ORF g.384286 m.384286 type:complete len:190 (+) comp20989_c0_seq2:316-885(+)